jgi:hypothetical protein
MRSLLALGLALCACESNNAGSGGGRDMSLPPLPCSEFGVSSVCGTACSTDADCGLALHCNAAKLCTAECLLGDSRCGDGRVCGPRGACVEVGDGGPVCPSVDVRLSPVIPTVMLLIDQSGSMTEDFNGISRWEAMKRALTGTSGALPRLDTKVRFGATLYTGTDSGMTPMCPMLKKLAPSLGNAAAIKTLLDMNQPLDDTPTGESLEAIIPDLEMPGPDPVSLGPTLIVLATDGDPDTCAAPDSNGTQPPKDVSIAAAKKAFAAGFPVIMLGVSPDINRTHLQDMANAGAGLTVGGTMNAKFYTANSPNELVTAFNDIIRGARTCTFKLEAAVDPAMAGMGDVELDGVDLGFMDANGWRLSNDTTLELLGSACQAFKDRDTVSLTAIFPCGVVIP